MDNFNLQTQQNFIYKKANNVECITELACSLADILSLGAKVSGLEYNPEKNGISYKAKIIFNIVYLLEGEVRRKEFGIELSDFYKMEMQENCNYYLDLIIEGVSAKRGEKLSLQGIANAIIMQEVSKQEVLLQERENCYTKIKEEEFSQLVGVVKNTFIIDDELEINRPLKNVLCSGGVAQIISCQCGLGSIICDGEILLSLALLPNQEKSDIIKETRNIPFRLELEESNVSINDLSCAEVKVNNVAIKVMVDEESGKTHLASQIEIILSAKAYKNLNVSYAEDMFSLNKELSVAKENITLKSFVKQKSLTQKIGGSAFCIPPDNSRIICVLEERVYGISHKVEQDKLILQGVASCYIAFEDINNGAICSKLAEMPFETEFIIEDNVDNLKVVCRSLQAKIRSDEIELEGELLISFNAFKQKKILAITKAEEGEDLQKDDSAFCIYCPQENDTVWDIAKALRISEQEILEQNELTFPLTGQEKIIIYKKA